LILEDRQFVLMGVWWKLHNEVEGDGQGWEAAAMVKER